MPTPQLLNDVISLLLLLAPSAALVSLVLAGVNLRREGGTVFVIGGGFTKWMFWAVVFLTLQPLLTWFSSFGINMPLPAGGIRTPWLASIQSDVASFVTNFVVGRIVPTMAAFFVLRAILDTASGEHPEGALVRELREELGLEIAEANLEPFHFVSHAYETFHLLMPVYLVRTWGGEPEAKESQPLAWVTADDIRNYPSPPADLPIYERFIDWSKAGRA